MAQKKYASLTTLTNLADKIKELFVKKTDFDTALSGKANSSHTHSIGNVTNLQSTLDGKATQTALNSHTSNTDIHFTADERTKLTNIQAGAQVNTVTGVKGNSETSYRTGNINITKANIGLGNVDNTADSAKTVKHATSADSATSATSATKATQDGNGKVISSTYETKTDAASKLTEAKTYADNAANTVKNDLLNNAGAAYDTLKELGDLIDDNKDAIDALEEIASGKANATHTHAISDVTNLQSALDGKANSSHGTHVTYSTTAPVMDGTASVGTASTVARSDHKHPTDTSRASKSEFDTHNADTTKHITSTERANWNAAKTHADSTHAPSNAEKNQNAFSNIAVSGQTTVAADTTTDTLTFAGSNVSITTDATNDKVTFSVADGTTSAKGVVQLTNSTSSTSTTTAATPNSVKSAYDLANQAKTAAANAQSTANSKADASHTHDYLPLAGGTVTGTTIFSKVQDAAADSYNAPAVVIGGQPTTYHLELDNNEIQAKQNETKAGNLFLNSNGGIVHVGFDGLKMDSESTISPEYALSSSIGTAELPFNRMFGRYYELYGAADTQYGRFRVGTTGTTTTAGVTTLELGNNKATGTAHNASGKITVYGSGTGFTNILPKTSASGSNSIYLPSGSGTLALEETSTKIAPVSQAEYTALEEAEATNANTLYMITDAEEEGFTQIQSDFNQTDSTQPDYIKNKPIYNVIVNQETGKVEQSLDEIVTAAQSGMVLICSGALSLVTDMVIENGSYTMIQLTMFALPNTVLPVNIYADGTVEMELSDNMQMKSDRVLSISAESTNTEYPTAKAVYDAIQNIDVVSEWEDIQNKPGEVITATTEINNSYTTTLGTPSATSPFPMWNNVSTNPSDIYDNIQEETPFTVSYLVDEETVEIDSSTLFTNSTLDSQLGISSSYTGYWGIANSAQTIEEVLSTGVWERADSTKPTIVVCLTKSNTSGKSWLTIAAPELLTDETFVLTLHFSETESRTIKLSNNALNLDIEPTEGSTNFINSDGIFKTLQNFTVTSTQSDWLQEDDTESDYIKNKIGSLAIMMYTNSFDLGSENNMSISIGSDKLIIIPEEFLKQPSQMSAVLKNKTTLDTIDLGSVDSITETQSEQTFVEYLFNTDTTYTSIGNSSDYTTLNPIDGSLPSMIVMITDEQIAVVINKSDYADYELTVNYEAEGLVGLSDNILGTGLKNNDGVLSLIVDTEPTEGSSNLLTSGTIKNEFDKIYDAGYQNATQVDTAIDTAIGDIDSAIAQIEAMVGGASS